MSLLSLHTINGLATIASEGTEPSALAAVVTNLVCFLLVIWILKRYAFGPMLKIIDERRETIESDLKKAEAIRVQAAAEKAELDEKLRNIQDEARQKMLEIVNEGKRIADSIQEDARVKAEAMIEKAKTNIQLETEKAREIIKTEVVNMTLAATERLIHANLDDSKQRDLINDFITQIERN